MTLMWLVAATPALALSPNPYLTPDKPHLYLLLPPPPASDSAEQAGDVAAVLALQKARSDANVRRVTADAEVSIFRFADVLGPKFDPAALPSVTAFFQKVTREIGAANNEAKDCWERPRPFLASVEVHPAGNLQASVAARPDTPNTAPHGAGSPCKGAEASPAYSYSYPSGHSTFGTATALLLAGMVPEEREALFARGREYGLNRIVGGVHFPSDVEAGRIGATVLVAEMMDNPEFKTDFDEAKDALRTALGLPQER